MTPGAAEDSTEGDPEIIENQSGGTVADSPIDQMRLCQILGGTAHLMLYSQLGGHYYLDGINVHCSGGLLDGMSCWNDTHGSVCYFFRGLTRPERDPRVTPTGGIVVDPESPTEPAGAAEAPVMPTEAATEAPAEPTAVATEALAEPTTVPSEAVPTPAEATEEPVEPTAGVEDPPVLPLPNDDDAVPPGNAEDPARNDPAPTAIPVQ